MAEEDRREIRARAVWTGRTVELELGCNLVVTIVIIVWWSGGPGWDGG